jgi:hypothetical protein
MIIPARWLWVLLPPGLMALAFHGKTAKDIACAVTFVVAVCVYRVVRKHLAVQRHLRLDAEMDEFAEGIRADERAKVLAEMGGEGRA